MPFLSSQYDEDSSSYVGSSDSSPVSISDKMRHLREELSRMINLLMNPGKYDFLDFKDFQHFVLSIFVSHITSSDWSDDV